MRNIIVVVYALLEITPAINRSLGKPTPRWVHNIKIYIAEIRWGVMD
jgi:hypothetical protein